MIPKKSAARTAAMPLVMAAVLLASAACGSGSGSGAPTGSSNGHSTATGTPVNVGVLAPFSGVLAGSGPPIKESVNLWLQKNNNSIAGHPVNLFVADDASTVAGEVSAARSLVEQHHVSIVVGLVNSAGALAVRDYLTKSKVLAMDVIANTDALLSPAKGPYLFVMPPTPQQTASAAAVLASTLNYKSIDVVADNFAGARSWVDPLVARFKDQNGSVVSSQFPPFPTSDYGPYISRVQSSASKADALVALMYGGDALAFLKQYRSFGVTLPLYSVGAMLEPTSTFLPAAKGTADGMYTYWNYSPELPGQANSTFTQLYQDQLHRAPGAFDMQAYTALDFLTAAYKAAGTQNPTTEQLAKALATTKVDSPVGNVSFNAQHGINWNMYLMKVGQGKDGTEEMQPQGPFVSGASAQQSVADAKSNLRQLAAKASSSQ